ncbi:DUF3108 domain-containing protein [Chitinimonas arctica]|uniref:DUF3108 domain-containing protein n=1 Tax=Chitinimonas arctica TaxID=2594795 RepID=A0A516SE83_9NEIS|nr:DUF3108 domain-containing protein [Chitinimonas arctica]QDQ26474.1 DUF3108 domain-containing protein [Chitinimonas arctica]
MKIARPLAATLLSCTALLSVAAGLPARAQISYEARLSGLPVGEATQRWSLEKDHYQLETEIAPIFGPRIRYVSSGTVGEAGIKPAEYAEFRGGSTPRQQARFDWTSKQVSYGNPESPQSAKLEAGAQELNTLPFQLSWLGTKNTATMQIMTGRKLRQDRFAMSDGGTLKLMGKSTPVRVWRTPDAEEGTEIWLAVEFGNLPVKIIRHDDKGELQLIAKTIEFQQE